MPKRTAGLLVYRVTQNRGLEVFLVHPGGPIWAKRDEGAWSIPKGQCDPEEEPLTAAKREFQEETGFPFEGVARDGDSGLMPLGVVNKLSGKIVSVWAVEGDLDASKVKSNTCPIEWPPRSGKQIEIPEVDRGEWFTMPEARVKILKGQAVFLDRLAERTGDRDGG